MANTALKGVPVPRRGRREVSKPVSFRLPAAEHGKLKAEAAEAGVSPGDLAKAILTASLKDEARLQILEELSQVRREVLSLRANIADTLQMVLVNLLPEDQHGAAKSWVSEHLRK